MRNIDDFVGDTAAALGEWVKDYVIIVRNNEGGNTWTFSDRTWALGATKRFSDRIETEDKKQCQD